MCSYITLPLYALVTQVCSFCYSNLTYIKYMLKSMSSHLQTEDFEFEKVINMVWFLVIIDD